MPTESFREHHDSPLRPALRVVDRDEKRLRELDVLRGLAMFGVLFVNVMVFAGDAGYGAAVTPVDRVVEWVRDTTFNGKAYLILAMVFGYSLGLQMRTAEAIPKRKRAMTRRLVALTVLGFAHGLLLYRFDILFAYGLLGYLAYRCRKLSTRALLALIATLTVFAAWVLLQSIDTRGLARVGPAVAIERYRSGSLSELIELHVHNHLANVTGEMTRQWPFAMAAILLGVLAERHNLVLRLKSPSPLRRGLGFVGVVGGALLLFSTLPIETPLPLVVDMVFQAAPLAFAIGVVTAVAATLRDGRVLSRAVGQVGRMSLSTYLMQSVICTTALYGFGFGLARFFTPIVQLAFTIVLFGLQIVFCRRWMATHRRGPIEELVRRWSNVPALRMWSTRPDRSVVVLPTVVGSFKEPPHQG
jgi:uncharacterized protein